jgi:hypothetical protein
VRSQRSSEPLASEWPYSIFHTIINRQCRPSTILYFSDNAPEGLQGLLSNHLPHTPKVIYALHYFPSRSYDLAAGSDRHFDSVLQRPTILFALQWKVAVCGRCWSEDLYQNHGYEVCNSRWLQTNSSTVDGNGVSTVSPLLRFELNT